MRRAQEGTVAQERRIKSAPITNKTEPLQSYKYNDKVESDTLSADGVSALLIIKLLKFWREASSKEYLRATLQRKFQHEDYFRQVGKNEIVQWART